MALIRLFHFIFILSLQFTSLRASDVFIEQHSYISALRQSSKYKYNTSPLLKIDLLPLGEGDSTIIKCPNGDMVVIDMGKIGGSGWTESMVYSYLKKNLNHVTTIIVSHVDSSHYSFIPTVFDSNHTKGLQRVILAGKDSDYTDSLFKVWLTSHSDILEYVNNQKPCISDCQSPPPICNGSYNVTFQYLGANLGMTKYGRSIMFRISAPKFSFVIPGDFVGSDIEELIVGEWSRLGIPINGTHMKLSRHGSNNDCNSKYFLQAISPSVAFLSTGYPNSEYKSPSCQTIERLLRTRSIKKRNNPSPFACYDSDNDKVDQYQSWPYKIYSTAPTTDDYQMISINVPITINRKN